MYSHSHNTPKLFWLSEKSESRRLETKYFFKCSSEVHHLNTGSQFSCYRVFAIKVTKMTSFYRESLLNRVSSSALKRAFKLLKRVVLVGATFCGLKHNALWGQGGQSM